MDEVANPTQAVHGRARGPRWQRVSHGVHIPSDHDAHLAAVCAAIQPVLPKSAAFSHLTSAMLRGWWLPPVQEDLPIFISMSNEDNPPQRSGVVACRHTQPVDTELRGGLRVATAAETILASARDLGVLDVVVLADAALYLGDCTLEELHAVAQRRRRGAPLLRRALRYVDPKAESAWESVNRVLHMICDIPVESQHEVFDDDGTLIARGDLWIVGTRRLREYDGEEHRRQARQTKDLRRDRRLRRISWERDGYTSHDLLYRAVAVLKDADLALGRPHRPERVRRWHRMLAESLFTPAGTARFRRRLRLPEPTQSRDVA